MTDNDDTPQMAHLIRLLQKSHPEHSADDIRRHLQDIADREPTYPDPMLPPWKELPHIPGWPSIGWRMSGGEDYLHDFALWLRKLPETERKEYLAAHPEPKTHQGLFAALLKPK